MPYGTEAMGTLRIEKGHVVIGAEADGRTTADDLGMGKLVNASKWCIGKPLLNRPALTAPDRWQLVGLTALDGAQIPRAAKLVADPDHAAPNLMLGHVTSWRFSPNLDAWIALALLSAAAIVWKRYGIAASERKGAREGRSLRSSILKASGYVSDPITLTEVPIAAAWNARRCVADFTDHGATVLDRTADRGEHNSARRCADGILARSALMVAGRRVGRPA
jgi:hypothetical protein